MSENTGVERPEDEETIDPDGDPDVMNPRDNRDGDSAEPQDPDSDPDSLNPRDDRPA